MLACNLSGPRRIKAGAARDHFLGFRAVSGRGEIFKAGGKVVKNVTGYDLCKLMAGSYGTLAALEEVTVKVLPRPEAEATVMLAGVAPEAASRADGGGARLAARGVGGRLPAHGLRPELSAAGLRGAAGGGAGAVGGVSPAGAAGRARRRSIDIFWTDSSRPHCGGRSAMSRRWRTSRTGRCGASRSRRAAAPSWREAVARQLDAVWFLDWGGGLVWLAVPEEGDGGAAMIRDAVGGAGHATLVKASPALRRAVAVFEPQPAPLAALSRRVKEAFDPAHILNPGRMVEGA